MLSLLLAASPAASPTPDITLNNGVRMPAIAAGTWQYTSDEAQRSAVAALQAGLTHIDTASDYCADGSTGDCSSKGGSNQRGISKALQGKPRASYFLTTKVPGCGLQGISRTACGEDSVAAADRNLAELGLDHVDLLLIHFPPEGGCGAANCALIRKQWRALVHSHLSTNKTRALGVSNFCVSCLDCLANASDATVTPAVNQFAYHIGMGADPEGLVTRTRAAGIVPQAYSPLGDNTSELISGELVSSIGHNHGKSGVQVALRWIWQHGVAVTTKSSNVAHLQEDRDIFGWELSDAEMSDADASDTPPGSPSFMCSS